MLPPPVPNLFAVADPARHSGLADPYGAAFGRWCSALAAAGVDGLQLRDRELGDRVRYARARAARQLLPPSTALYINGRADIARAAAADGVQLPAAGLPLAPLRAAFGRRLRFGRSTHTADEVWRAREEGFDFVLFGPIFDTPSKRGRIEPLGLAALAAAARLGLPVIAIGGIDAGNAAAVAAAGASGIAAIRLFAEPGRDAEAIAGLRALWSVATP